MGSAVLALSMLASCSGRSVPTVGGPTATQGEPIVGVWVSNERPTPAMSKLEIVAAPGDPAELVAYNESSLTAPSAGPTLVPGDYIHRTGDLTTETTATYRTDDGGKSFSIDSDGLLTVEYQSDAGALMVSTFRRQ